MSVGTGQECPICGRTIQDTDRRKLMYGSATVWRHVICPSVPGQRASVKGER